MTCPICGDEVTWAPGPGREARAGTVAAAVERCPVRVCVRGHRSDASVLAGELGDRLVQALGVARRRRLQRADRCVACDAALTMPVRRTDRTVTVDDLPTPLLTVVLDVPATRCPECGLEQVPSRSGRDLMAVVAALLDAGPG